MILQCNSENHEAREDYWVYKYPCTICLKDHNYVPEFTTCENYLCVHFLHCPIDVDHKRTRKLSLTSFESQTKI